MSAWSSRFVRNIAQGTIARQFGYESIRSSIRVLSVSYKERMFSLVNFRSPPRRPCDRS